MSSLRAGEMANKRLNNKKLTSNKIDKKIMRNSPKNLLRYLQYLFILFASFFLNNQAFGEGTADIYQYGGDRIVTVMEGFNNSSHPGFDDMVTDVYAYAEEGEILNMAFTKNVDGWGYIEYFSPNGNAYRCEIPGLFDPTKEGFIESAAQEFAGPHAVGGYVPCEYTVGAGEAGVWKIEFVSTIGAGTFVWQTQGNAYEAQDEWAVSPGDPGSSIAQIITGQDVRWGSIIAWDVTVSSGQLDIGGIAIPGRVFVTQFVGQADSKCDKNGTLPCSIVTEGSGGIVSHKFFIQTVDGYTFDLLTNAPMPGNNLGYEPYSYVMFANNRGVTDNTGSQTFQSTTQTNINNGTLFIQRPDLADPILANCPDCERHKMFFSTPAGDIPIGVLHSVAIRSTERDIIPGANQTIFGPSRNNLNVFPIFAASGITPSSTWLVNILEVPEFSNFHLVGIEGTVDQVGEGMGGYIRFECQPAGGAPASVCDDIGPGGKIVDLALDFAGNGIIDLVIPAVDISVGINNIPWDGTDDNNGGTPVPAALYNNATIQVQGGFGEVHFPTIDAEHNENGWTLGRLNGPNASVGTPDYTIFWDDTTVGGNQSPMDGTDSSGGAHDWNFAVGNINVVDTYAFAVFGVFGSPFEMVRADLRVVSVTTDVGATVQHEGDTVEFTVTYINDGPSIEDNATLFFDVDSTFFTNFQFVANSCTETILPGNLPLPTQTACGPDANGNVTGANYTRTSIHINPGDQIEFKVTADIVANNSIPLTPGATGPTGPNIGSILRSADVFDPNATNPDAAVPTSVQAECESNTGVDAGTDYPGGGTAFGTDCNNAGDVTVNVERYDAMPAIAKDAAITNNNDGTYTVAFTFNIENAGLTDLFDVQITDNVVSAVGAFNAGATVNGDLSSGEYFIPPGGGVSIDSITDNNTPGNALLTANPAFNGAADQNLLLISNVNPSQLGIGDTAVISFTIVVNPNFDSEPISYENSAQICGDFAEDFVSDGDAKKFSNDGVIPDPDDSSPTPILLPKIGLAKSVTSFVSVGAVEGAFDAELQFIISNIGNVDLTNIALTDDLTAPLGTHVGPAEVSGQGEYRVLVAPSDTTDAGSTITVNPNFNGDGDTLIAGDTNDLLQIGDSSTITLTVRYTPDFNAPTPTYLNIAIASGEDADGTTTQVQSADGTDPTQSPFPGDTPDPTPIPTGGIRVTKELISGPTEVTACAKSIVYRITTENVGSVPLYDLRVTEDLSSSDFGAYNGAATIPGDLAESGEYFFPAPGISQTLNNNSGNSALTLNTNYNGEVDIELVSLTLNDALHPGDSVVHEIPVLFSADFETPSADLYDNVAFAYADIDENGTSEEDISDVSDNLGNDLANDPNTAVPVPLILPQIALLKTADPVTQNADGTYNTVIKLRARNVGNQALFNVQLRDVLDPSFGAFNAGAVGSGDLTAGQYFISTAPSISILNGAPVLTLNGSFNGAGDANLLTLNAADTMAINDEIEIEFTITTNRLFQAGPTNYINQALSHGYITDDVNNNIPANPDDPTDADTFDLSNDGSYYDPNNPDDFCPADNSEPTPSPAPLFNLNKAHGNLTENGDGTFSVDYTLTIENTFVNGIAIPDVFDFQVTEDLATTFGTYNASPTSPGEYNVTGLAVNVTVDGPAVGPTVLAVDNTFDGDAQQNILLVDNVSGYVLRAGDTIEVTYTVNIIPNFGNLNVDSFDNMFSVSGDEVEDGTTDGQFFKDSNEVELPLPRIGVSKVVSNVTYDTVTDTFSAIFAVRVRNYGNRDLYDIFVRDDLTTNFGTYVGGVPASAGEYTITAAPTIDTLGGTAVITANGSFDGDSDQDLVDGQAPGTILPIGEGFVIGFAIQLYPDINSLSYLNSAFAHGYLVDDGGNNPDNVTPDATDESTNAVDPANDPVANPNPDNPTDPEEYTSPTPLPLPIIQNEKTISRGPVINEDDCTIIIQYRITTSNLGTVPLYDIQVTEDLASSDFGTYNAIAANPSDLAHGEYYLFAATVQNLNNNSGNSALTLNTNYNGEGDINLLTLTPNDVLQPGDSVVHDVTVAFHPEYENLTDTTYDNVSFSYGDLTENGASDGDVSDVSGNSFNNPNRPDAVPFDAPKIAVLKIAETAVQNLDGTYDTVLKIRARNTGNRDLYNVQLFDSLAEFGNFNNAAVSSGDLSDNEYYIKTAPSISTLNGTPVLTVNASYNGSSPINAPTSASELLVLNGGDVLNIGDEIEVTFEVTTKRLYNSGFSYDNQAIGYGYITDDVNNNTPSSLDPVTGPDTDDESNNATYYDPEDPEDVCPDEDAVTPNKVPFFDLLKEIVDSTDNGNGTITIDYKLTIGNLFDRSTNGTADVYDFQATEDLATTFGTYNVTPTSPGEYNVTGLALNIIDGPFPDPSVLALDTSFDGDTKQNLFLVDNVSGYIFKAGDTLEITYSVTIMANFGSLNVDSFDNKFSVEGDSTPDGTTDGEYTKESNEVEYPLPRIGISKVVENSVYDPQDGSFTVDYRFYVENYGNRDLYDVFVRDNFSTNFGTYVVGNPTGPAEYTITGGPTIQNLGGSSTIIANGAFNGETDEDMVDGQAGGTILAIGEGFEISLTVRLIQDTDNYSYDNSATAHGYLVDDGGNDPNNVTPDTSDDSTNFTDPIDPATNPTPDNPTDPNEYTSPTPLPLPIIGMAKDHFPVEVNGEVNNNDPDMLGTFDIVFRIIGENRGNIPLYDIQIEDDMAEYGTLVLTTPSVIGEYQILAGPSFSGPDYGLILNPNFNGETDVNIFDIAASNLNGAEFTENSEFEINYTVRFFYDWTEGLGLDYLNQGIMTAAIEPSGPIVVNVAAADSLFTAEGFFGIMAEEQDDNLRDTSDEGLEPDDDGDGNASDDCDPTLSEIPQVAIAKEATRVEAAVGGLYEIDYVVYVENTGNVELIDTELLDVLTGPRGVGTTYVAGTPDNVGEYTITAGPTINLSVDGGGISTAVMPANTSYNGDGDANLVDTPNSFSPNDILEITFTVQLFPPDFSPVDPDDPHFNGDCVYEIDNQATVNYFFLQDNLSRDSYVYDNGPLNPLLDDEPVTVALAFPELSITKIANKQVVSVGDIVTWTITVTNDSDGPVGGIGVSDTLPLGLSYLGGSSVVNGVAQEPDEINGNVLTWDVDPGEFPDGIEAGESFTIIFSTTVTPVSSNTSITNVANIFICNESVAEARATIRLEDDPLMTCSEIVGEVFYKDRSLDADPDNPHIGLARTILYTTEGLKVTTDDNGKFHISCIDVTTNRGQNFIMKLDERSLPIGYRVKSENPRVVRLTKGKAVKIEFEVGIDREVSITLDDSNFIDGTALLNKESETYLHMLVEELVKEKSVLSITLYSASFDPELKQARKEQMENIVKQLWKKVAHKPYKLDIQIQTLSY